MGEDKIEAVAQAIYDADNGVDGDTIAEALGLFAEAHAPDDQAEYLGVIKGICRLAAEAAVRALGEQGFAVVPVEPSEGLLASMAMRRNHGVFAPGLILRNFGDDRDERPHLFPGSPGYDEARRRMIEVEITEARQVHEEVVGRGFYSVKKEADYRATLARALGP